MAGGAEPHGWVGLIDRRHHVGARVDKSSGEVIVGWGCVAGLPGVLLLGVLGDKARPRGIGGHGPLGDLVELGLCGLGLLGLEERAGGNSADAAFKVVESADAIVKEFKGLVELVGGNLTKPVIGQEEGILSLVKQVGG